ncbi:MAG: FKBP-type peptidyl-prolyl cis-trans isomerase [Prevotellaceae bacterium]|nr:FKBP-type peptidyl-prolyl cis-trans isomerase [Prevotellaceae bacterium]
MQAQCGSPREQRPYAPAASQDKLRLQEVNRYLSEKEQDILKSYIGRQQLDMEESSTGYFCQVVVAGSGDTIAAGDVVQLRGRIFLIDGAPCYTYSGQRLLEVATGSYSGITALNVALVGLRQGDHVRLVIPSHLAFGLLGDGDRIPPRSPLVCDFFVEKVTKK